MSRKLTHHAKNQVDHITVISRPRDKRGRFVKQPQLLDEYTLASLVARRMPLEVEHPTMISRQHYALIFEDFWGEGRTREEP